MVKEKCNSADICLLQNPIMEIESLEFPSERITTKSVRWLRYTLHAVHTLGLSFHAYQIPVKMLDVAVLLDI